MYKQQKKKTAKGMVGLSPGKERVNSGLLSPEAGRQAARGKGLNPKSAGPSTLSVKRKKKC